MSISLNEQAIVSANSWNCRHVEWLIEYAEKVKTSLELFEELGREADMVIDDFIMHLSLLKANNKMV